MNRPYGPMFAAAIIGILTVGATGAQAGAKNAFVETDLVSDQPGHAKLHDKNLVNAWGIAFAPNDFFWINDNGAGVSTLYDGKGKPNRLVVQFPLPPKPRSDIGKVSNPTGMVWNPTNDFVFAAWAQIFLFDSEDGTITGWFSDDGPEAQLIIDNSQVGPSGQCPGVDCPGAVYKGLALGTASGGNVLYATNFRAGTVEAYNGKFKPMSLSGDFTDPDIPAGFAPFNVANIDGQLFVTYAMQDDAKHDDVAGAGNGFVDIFDTDGNLVKRFASAGPLNSPWGVVKAPHGFGPFGGAILIGNFGDGKINAYSPSGKNLGQMKNQDGKPMTIDGLWGLTFGGALNAPPSRLYFTAGPKGESHGLFGSIVPK